LKKGVLEPVDNFLRARVGFGDNWESFKLDPIWVEKKILQRNDENE
jgi:hypothetical protein